MRRQILIIEDNEQNMYLTRFILESFGHEVLQAMNGIDGIKLAKETKPDGIILDIQLPEMNGYEVLEACRKDSELANIPIIAVTSYAMAGDRERCLEAGATGYIEKPINPDTFMTQVEQFLESQD